MYHFIRKSLLRKLTLAITVVTFIPLFTCVFAYLNNISYNFYENKVKSAQNTLSQIAVNMNATIESFDKYADYLANDNKIMGFVMFPQDEAETVDIVMNYINPWVKQLKLYNSAIENIRILHCNESLFNVNNILYMDKNIAERIKNLMNINIGSRLPVKGIEYCSQGWNYLFTPYSVQDLDVWYIYHVISPISYTNPSGLIEISINNRVLCNSIQEYPLEKDEFIQLVTDSKQVSYSNGILPKAEIDYSPLLKSGTHKIQIGNQSYIVASRRIDLFSSTLLLFMKEDNLTMTGQRWFLLTMSVVILLLSMLFVAALVSRLILKKLILLSNEIDSIDLGHINQIIHIDSADETGKLVHSFNQMLERLSTSFNRERELLYAQLTNNLKPHFICNTMDMLRIQAENSGDTDISNSIGKINQYFRYSMMYARDTVSLIDEVNDTINYIELVNIMRQNKITLSLSLDAWCEKNGNDVKVPKLILQPIVENAIRHGLAGKAMSCITIQIHFVDNAVRIVISDNGMGMEPDKLDALRRTLDIDYIQTNGESRHMGLINVFKRLDLHMNGKFALNVDSLLGSGTIVTITMCI